MIPVLTASEMRSADRHTIEEIGLPGVVLMENAGAAVARALRERHPRARRPLVLCGKGNNGGDGFVAARRLIDLEPTVLLAGKRGEVKGDAAVHLGAYERSGGRLLELPDRSAWRRARARLTEAEVIVDALLGTGLREAPSGLMGDIIRHLAATRAGREVPVVAVDIPSGLSSDTGHVAWQVAGASLTVTFGAPKWGHVIAPSCNLVGELVVADIGIPRHALVAAGTRLWVIEESDAARAFPPRAPASHKGSYGHLLVVAGGLGKTGAAVLAAEAALRTGAGLVTVATPAAALPLVASGRPEVMTEPLPEAGGGLGAEACARALALAEARDAVVLGPGMGQQESARSLALELVRRCTRPLLVDADGLNALASGRDAKSGSLPGLPRRPPTILTPHPGEMARLLGTTTAQVQRSRVESARALARITGAFVVLKGQRSVVAAPDGEAFVNPTGNPGMATAGTGDVLAGIVGALLARGAEPRIAATSGAFLHGMAGDLAAGARGVESLLAGDVTASLPDAIRALQRNFGALARIIREAT